ncbi:hypothetical protein ACIQYG_01380 [Peribacillus sp. NPDC096622]|uniref:hypothetical protein n=1 Tax=Peribacillus sp. NPDC096622 TaxID=3364396 RepID=UPI00381C3F68
MSSEKHENLGQDKSTDYVLRTEFNDNFGKSEEKDAEVPAEVAETTNVQGVNVEKFITTNTDAGRTQAFKDAFAHIKTNGEKVLRIPEGEFVVNNTILELTADDYLEGIEIIGAGSTKSIIRINPTNDTTPLIKLDQYSLNYLHIRDIQLAGTSKKGVALKFGNVVTGKNVSRSTLDRVYIKDCKMGIDAYGWIVNFNSCDVRYCETGIKSYINAFNLVGANLENNVIGVQIDDGMSVNFLGGTIEGNENGLVIKKGVDINLFGVYFEHNTTSHILAGISVGDSIKSLNILGCSFSFVNPVTFDRVDNLKIINTTGINNLGYLNVTENVKRYDVDFSESGNTYRNFFPSKALPNQSKTPFFSTDLSEINSVANGFVDVLKNVVKLYNTRTDAVLETSDILSGKGVKYTYQIGQLNSGFSIFFYSPILNRKKFSVSLRTKMSNGVQKFRRHVIVNYKDTLNVAKTYTIFDDNLDVATYTGMKNTFVTHVVPVDMNVFTTNVKDVSTIDSITVNANIVTSPALATVEYIILDGFDLYNSLYPSKTENELKTNASKPYVFQPSIVQIDEYMTLGKKRHSFGTTAPTTGSWEQGEIVYNTSPTSGGKLGWVCVATGTPGTWKAFGAIDA